MDARQLARQAMETAHSRSGLFSSRKFVETLAFAYIARWLGSQDPSTSICTTAHDAIGCVARYFALTDD